MLAEGLQFKNSWIKYLMMTEIRLFLPSSKPCNIPIAKDIFITRGAS